MQTLRFYTRLNNQEDGDSDTQSLIGWLVGRFEMDVPTTRPKLLRMV
jgi:hypothetical protein